jgi:mono/diheme cytochrome c family protein
MRRKAVIGAISLVAVIASVPMLSFGAEDGAALYKTKCSGCHGASGEGKPVIKAPALKGTSWDVDRIVQHITKGEPDSKAPHNKGISGVNDAKAKAIAEFVKTLK